MKLVSPAILKTLYEFRGDFAEGVRPQPIAFSGVIIAPFKNNAAAALSITGDLELSWAWRGRGEDVEVQRGTSERKNVPLILDLLDDYNIPITWATVGHLCLESCRRSTSGVPHPEMPRPRQNNRWNGDWYLHDPCSDFKTDPLWYAPDLVQQIVTRRVRHELGTHTFSHINFSPERLTPELVECELQTCIEVMKPFGQRPTSIVFPHNIVNYSYLDVFRQLGIRAARHRDARINLSYPECIDDGFYRLYETMHLRAPRHYDYFEKAKIFLQEAMRRHAAFCLWFHPSDSTDLFSGLFARMLDYFVVERSKRRLWIATMKDIAEYCEAREKTRLQVKKEWNSLTILIHKEGCLSVDPELTLLIPMHAAPQLAWQENQPGTRMPLAFEHLRQSPSSMVAANVRPSARSITFVF